VLSLALTPACGSSESPTQPPPLTTECVFLVLGTPSTLDVGETRRMGAGIELCYPNYLPLSPDQVVWHSVDPSVASVSGDMVTGVVPGPAVVQCTYGNITQQALVIVGSNLPQSGPSRAVRLRIFGSPTMGLRQRASFGAFITAADGTVSRVSAAAVWNSTEPAVAGLLPASSGVSDRAVEAYRTGSASIRAVYQGMTATMAVEVR
jgi:hypothetical protein